jgi:abortive infection bacteriophage resistance protein
MFGREEHQGDEDEEVAVDATLASDLASVEQSIDVYLKDPSVDLRTKLLDVLERLDAQIDRSDAYEKSVIGSAALGYSSKGSVIGETSSASAAENISESVLLAQTILIKAAKREVTTPTPETLADLHAVSQALAAERSKQVD